MRKYSRWQAASLWMFSLVALAFAQGLMAAEQRLGPWVHTSGREHPLAGRVWDVKNGTWLDPEVLAQRLENARHVMLGEKHDNADHHRLQAWLIQSLSSAGRRPAVAFEMLSIDEQGIVDRQLENAPSDLAGLRAAVRWDEKGWPEWELYEPVFRVALASGLPIVAANLSRAAARELAAQGVSAAGADLVRDFELDRPLPPEIRRRLAGELESSHCGHASAGTIEKMIVVQRTRDAHMARQLLVSGRENGAVLIAGAFHVRNDYAVPAQLVRRGSGAGVVSVGFVEVRDEVVDPGGYAAAFGMESLPFDYVWFTPRVDDEEPCETFAKQLKRIR